MHGLLNLAVAPLLALGSEYYLFGAAGLVSIVAFAGLILAPALLVEAFLQWRADPHRRLRAGWLAVGGAGIGFWIYLALNQVVYGDLLAFTDIQRGHWGKELKLPWEGIASVLGWFRSDDPDAVFMNGGMELLFIAMGLLATVATAIWLRPTWAVWMAGNWLLITSTGFVLSVPHYALVLFPLFAWFAVLPDRWRWGVAAVSIVALAYFAARFAAGQWAF